MPRLTSRVFMDLAVWMAGFGLVTGLVFPPFCLALGLPAGQVLTPLFFASTVTAGLVVGFVNYQLARLVVGRRLRLLAERMATVEGRLAEAVFSHDWSTCDPASCALPVDSDDEVGASSAAFNSLLATLSRSHEVESAMRSFSGVLSRESELDGLARAALEELMAHTGAAAGAVLVARDEALAVVASHGLRAVEELGDNDHVRRALRRDASERIAVSEGAPVVDSLLVGQQASEILVGSVTFRGIPMGAVVLATTSAFAPDAERLLEQFRHDLGLAVNNALAHDRLERLAAIDPLTDAYNRRFGLARLREEFSRAVRAESPLGILMVDLDHFKAINDTYGHLAGDRVLRTAAAACRRVLREGDILVRYGGEEFLVLLPGAGPTDLALIGERLRRAMEETHIIDGDQRISVTVSVGGTAYGDEVDSPDALIDQADAALYRAKESGRNVLVIA